MKLWVSCLGRWVRASGFRRLFARHGFGTALLTLTPVTRCTILADKVHQGIYPTRKQRTIPPTLCPFLVMEEKRRTKKKTMLMKKNKKQDNNNIQKTTNNIKKNIKTKTKNNDSIIAIRTSLRVNNKNN